MKQLCLIAALAVANARGASADPAESTSAAKVPIARRMYDEGIEASSKARWALAYDRFKASYELSPRVLTLFNLANAQAQTGRPLEAGESYRRFLRDTSDGRYPDLRAEAMTKLDQVDKQVAQLTLELVALEPSDAVAIDDVEFPRSVLREPIALNPGVHVAIVRRGDTQLVSRTVTLTPGESEAVHIDVPRPVDLVVHPADPPAASAATVTVTALTTTPPSPSHLHRSALRSPWLWSAAAVVVAGSVTAAYLLTRPDADTLVVH